jgi:hypothetical protein
MHRRGYGNWRIDPSYSWNSRRFSPVPAEETGRRWRTIEAVATMDLKGGSSYDSITTIHGIGEDWGRLPHRQPFYVKRLRDRRKEHGHYTTDHQGQEHLPQERRREEEGSIVHGPGFEIIV